MSNSRVGSIGIGSIVRAITAIGPYAPRIVYAQVLALSVGAEHLGEQGQPSLTLAYLDHPDHRQLGGPSWHTQMKREFGVRHVSHEDVVRRLTSVYWVDVLPLAGEEIDLPDLRDPNLMPSGASDEASETRTEHHAPTAPPVPHPEQTAANPAPPIQAIELEHTLARHAPDSIVYVETTNGERRQVKMSDLEPGNYLPDLQLTVTSRTFQEGILYFQTMPRADDASETEDTPSETEEKTGAQTQPATEEQAETA